ncbi:hypothetical protein [Falsiroseomonas sp. E2-1-a20]|uniref:hypothetical protein n=1 Tax=Falsiroseomonas sp. E2-1-a20 TaxID=3239300 RepID=UPI003F37C962
MFLHPATDDERRSDGFLHVVVVLAAYRVCAVGEVFLNGTDSKEFALAHWLPSGASGGRVFVRVFNGAGNVREDSQRRKSTDKDHPHSELLMPTERLFPAFPFAARHGEHEKS